MTFPFDELLTFFQAFSNRAYGLQAALFFSVELWKIRSLLSGHQVSGGGLRTIQARPFVALVQGFARCNRLIGQVVH